MKTRDRRRRRIKSDEADPSDAASATVAEINLTDTSCNVCQAEFLDGEELERHVFQMHLTNFDRGRYCKFCKILLPSMEDFARHIRDEHIADLRACQFCFRVFADDAGLRAHERKHQVIPTKSMFSCSQCALLFRNLCELTAHEYQQHEGCVEGVMLNGCFTYLSALLNMKAHSFLQTLRRSSDYTCLKCHLRTPKLKHYINHLKKNKCQSWVCSSCCNVYVTPHSLCRHFANHPECEREGQQRAISDVVKVNSPAIACKSCDKVFDTVTQLSQHQGREHPLVVTVLKCQYCRNDIVGSVALKKHIERAHKHEVHLYKYKCRTCSYIYKHPKDLFAHFFSKHKDLEPYTCKICNKTFRVRKKFSLHIKLDHNSVGTVEFDDNFYVYFTDANTKGGSASVIVPDHDYGRKIPIHTTRVEVADEHNTANVFTDDCKVRLDDNKVEELDISVCNVDEKENVKEESPFENSDKLEKSHIDSKVNVLDNCTTVESDNNKKDVTTSTHSTYLPVDQSKSTINMETDSEYQQTVYLESSDDEPLINIKKQKNIRRRFSARTGGNRNNPIVKAKSVVKFTCKICKKYCYTFQNYNRHMSFHLSKESKQCIKCGKLFKKTNDLEEHVKVMHASSKLTETLQMVLRRQKTGTQPLAVDSSLTASEKIRLTVKKVNCENISNSATVREVSSKEDLSVKKFLESFTPEISTENKQSSSNGLASVRIIDYPVANKSTIQLTKVDFEKAPIPFQKLAMPVQFSKPYSGNVQKANIALVQGHMNRTSKLNFGYTHGSCTANEEYISNNDYLTGDDFVDDVNYSNVEIDYNLPNKGVNDELFSDMIANHNQAQDDYNSIPEMAHEVSLEGGEERPRTNLIQKNIILPRLPAGFDQVRIAHLLPQAPYFKIVKMEELLSHSDNETTPLESDSPKETDLKVDLPSGRKLVNVNPLEHLMRGKNIHLKENKYYKSKKRDFQNVIAKAFMNLDKLDEKKLKKKKIKDKSEIKLEP